MLHLLPYEVSRKIILEISKQPCNTEKYISDSEKWNVLDLRLVSSRWDRLVLYDIQRNMERVFIADSSCTNNWKEYYQEFVLKKFIPLYQLKVKKERPFHNESLNSYDIIEKTFETSWDNMQGTINVRLGIYFEDLGKIPRSHLLLHKLEVKLNSARLFVPELLSYQLLGKKSTANCNFRNQIVIVDLGPIKKESEYTLELKVPISSNASNNKSMELLFLEFGEAPPANEWLWCNFHFDHLNDYLEHFNISQHVTYEFRYGNQQKKQKIALKRNQDGFCRSNRDPLVSSA
ncbi:hypothetical protein ACO0QE_002008 [Hanseniaspora vineae]